MSDPIFRSHVEPLWATGKLYMLIFHGAGMDLLRRAGLLALMLALLCSVSVSQEGDFIHHDLGERAFALGFSEYSGSYAFGRHPAQMLTRAPNDSLEGRAFAGNGLTIRYFGLNELRTLGPIAARPLGDFKTAKWDDVLDGLVVFREEHPPTVPAKSGGE